VNPSAHCFRLHRQWAQCFLRFRAQFFSNRGSSRNADNISTYTSTLSTAHTITKHQTMWNLAFSDSFGHARSILRHQPENLIRLGTLHFDSVCAGLGSGKELQVVMLCRLSYSILNFDVPASVVTHIKPNRKCTQHASPYKGLASFMCPSVGGDGDEVSYKRWHTHKSKKKLLRSLRVLNNTEDTNSDIVSPSRSAHESLWTEALWFTVLGFKPTLDVLPQITVKKRGVFYRSLTVYLSWHRWQRRTVERTPSGDKNADNYDNYQQGGKKTNK
jgi:hypothetical protein